ncbi:MAG: S16 family serine protease [Candidatus Anstonellales archaeon]
MRGLLILLLFVGTLYSCSDAEVIAPSVTGGKGELIRIRVEAEPGAPEILLKIDPVFGETVQRSIQSAYAIALMKAGNSCRVKVYVQTMGTVDGPSAGAAFALAFYSALSDTPLPKNYVITGTIRNDSSIGAVGGIFEKAKAANDAGLPFIAGGLSNGERAALMELGIDFTEAKDFTELVDIVINNTTPNKTLPFLSTDYEPIPYEENEFSSVARMLMAQEELLADGLSSAELRDYYKEEIKRQEELLSRGYVLPAANEAFSGASTLYAIKNLNRSREEIKAEIEGCISSVQVYPLTESNFEGNAFAIVRLYRAKEALDELPLNEEDRIGERVRMGNAYMWCLAAKKLVSRGEGAEVDESAVEVDTSGIDDPFYSAVISKLLEDGHNVSAYYELAYAKSNATGNLSNGSFQSKIGKLYYSYSAYALANGNKEDAILWLENANSAEKLFQGIPLKEENKEENNGLILLVAAFGAFIAAWLLLLILFLLSKLHP